MAKEYQKRGAKGLLHLFHQQLAKALERQGYSRQVHMGQHEALEVDEYSRDDAIVALSVSEVGLDELEVRIESETVNLDEILVEAVADLIHAIVFTFVEPQQDPQLAKKLKTELLQRLEGI